jgi:hypothetical protein
MHVVLQYGQRHVCDTRFSAKLSLTLRLARNLATAFLSKSHRAAFSLFNEHESSRTTDRLTRSQRHYRDHAYLQEGQSTYPYSVALPTSPFRNSPTDHYVQIQREHKKADKAGTRAPVKANGLPVKAPKPTSIVRNYVSILGQQNMWLNGADANSARTAAAKSSIPTRSSSKRTLSATIRQIGPRRSAGPTTSEHAKVGQSR